MRIMKGAKGPRLWVLIGHDRRTTEMFNRGSHIINAVKELLPGCTNPKLIHLQYAQENQPRPNAPRRPQGILLWNIDQAHVDYLVQRRIVDTPSCWLIFLPLTLKNAELVGTYESLPYTDNPAEVEREVEEAYRVMLSENVTTLSPLITKTHDAIPNDVAANQCFQWVLDSVRVSHILLTINGSTTPVYRVYMSSPTYDPRAHANLIEEIHKMKLRGETWVCQFSKLQWMCGACKSIDHPYGICPFNSSNIPGFHNRRLNAAGTTAPITTTRSQDIDANGDHTNPDSDVMSTLMDIYTETATTSSADRGRPPRGRGRTRGRGGRGRGGGRRYYVDDEGPSYGDY
jgi:hypothetical protein